MTMTSIEVCQGIEMLPVVDDMIKQEIDESHARLLWLTSAKDDSQMINSNHLQQLVDIYDQKGVHIEKLKKQCAHWRNVHSLTLKQKEMLTSLERHLVVFEKSCYQGLTEIQQIFTYETR